MSGLQVEVGSRAADFEHLSCDVEVQRCFRYYISYSPLVNGGDNTDYVANGSYYTDTVFNAIINLPTMMRTDPSIIDSNSSDYYRIYRSAGKDAIASFDTSGISGGGLTIRFYVSGLTDNNKSGQIGQVFVQNASAILAFSAEL